MILILRLIYQLMAFQDGGVMLNVPKVFHFLRNYVLYFLEADNF